MAANKTAPTDADANEFLATIENGRRRGDGHRLLEMMTRVTGEPAVMWGPSIVGFGSLSYRYASGRAGDTAVVGFSPRKSGLSLYGLTAAPEAPALLATLGKHQTGVACLYVNKLDDIDVQVLEELIALGYAYMQDAGEPQPGLT